MKQQLKPGQFRRHPSKGSLGRETKEEKKSEKNEFLVFEKDMRKGKQR